MSRFFLIRHGTFEGMNQRIVGRMPNVHLSETGRAQIKQLASELDSEKIEAVCSSPLERAKETAGIICQRLQVPMEIENAFNEIDFGRWTNCTFESLCGDPEWNRFNSFRSNAAAPGGELMLAAQARAVAGIEQLRERYQAVAVVSHGDVIRALIAHFLGFNLDFIHRIRIDPASLTILEIDKDGAQFSLINGKAAAGLGSS